MVRFGIEFAKEGCMPPILLRANNNVRNRAERGKLPRTWISLSVKSIASWGYHFVISIIFSNVVKALVRQRNEQLGGKALTPATPKFSIAGILCPAEVQQFDINSARLKV